jgi:hypothetical protein
MYPKLAQLPVYAAVASLVMAVLKLSGAAPTVPWMLVAAPALVAPVAVVVVAIAVAVAIWLMLIADMARSAFSRSPHQE